MYNDSSKLDLVELMSQSTIRASAPGHSRVVSHRFESYFSLFSVLLLALLEQSRETVSVLFCFCTVCQCWQSV